VSRLGKDLLLVALLVSSGCGDDGAGGSKQRGDVPADSGDCKEAKKIASDCGRSSSSSFDCKTDRFQVECAIEYPEEYCENEGIYFACIFSKSDDYYSED